jgi:peroxiredoxin
MRWKIYLNCILVLFLLLFIHPFAGGSEEELFSKIGIAAIRGDNKVPVFSLKDLNGKKVEIKQFKGKIILINFWATWCAPCKEEMPSMEILHRQFEEKNFVLLTVSVDYGGVKSVQEFINKHQYTFPVLLDPKGEIFDLFKVKGIPTTFLVDKKGKMIGKAIGPRDWKSQEVFSLISLLIEK